MIANAITNTATASAIQILSLRERLTSFSLLEGLSEEERLKENCFLSKRLFKISCSPFYVCIYSDVERCKRRKKTD